MEGPDRERREQQEDDVGYPFPRPAGTMCRAERREDHRSDREEVRREEERKAREIIYFVGRAPERLLQCRVPAPPKRPPEGGQAPTPMKRHIRLAALQMKNMLPTIASRSTAAKMVMFDDTNAIAAPPAAKLAFATCARATKRWSMACLMGSQNWTLAFCRD